MRYLVRRPRSGFSLFNDDLFNDFFNVGFSNKVSSLMRTDVIEEDDKYVLNVDIPGFNKEDIKVTFADGYLRVEAKKEEATEQNETNYIRRERHYGSCSREFYLGEIDEEQIKANYTNGILNISVPKLNETEDAKIKTITIE